MVVEHAHRVACAPRCGQMVDNPGDKSALSVDSVAGNVGNQPVVVGISSEDSGKLTGRGA